MGGENYLPRPHGFPTPRDSWCLLVAYPSAARVSQPSLSQTLCLRQNLIKCIENLEELHGLRELDLYDNQIKKIENLDALTELE